MRAWIQRRALNIAILGLMATPLDALPSVFLVDTGQRASVYLVTTDSGSVAIELSLVMQGLELWHPVVNSETFDQPNPGNSPFIQGSPIGGDSYGLTVDDEHNRLFLSYGTSYLPASGTWKVLDFGYTGLGSVLVQALVAQNGMSVYQLMDSGTVSTNIPILTGDFNADRLVDAADYTIWRDSIDQEGIGLDADANRDGVVNDSDYSLWASAYNLTGSSSQATRNGGVTAPEPTACLTALSSLALLACSTRGIKLSRPNPRVAPTVVSETVH